MNTPSTRPPAMSRTHPHRRRHTDQHRHVAPHAGRPRLPVVRRRRNGERRSRWRGEVRPLPGPDGRRDARHGRVRNVPAPQGDPRRAGGGDLPLVTATRPRTRCAASKWARSTTSGKPFNATELLARVNTHLTLQRLRRQMEARNAELARELEVAQELLTDARRRVDGALLGDSPAIRALRESIARHAADAEPVLLTGPRRRSRSDGPRHPPRLAAKPPGIHPRQLRDAASGTGRGILSPPAAAAELPRRSPDARLSLLELATEEPCTSKRSNGCRATCRRRLAEVLERARGRARAGRAGGTRRARHRLQVGAALRGERVPSEAAGAARTQTAARAVARGAPRRRRGDCAVLPSPARAPDWRRRRDDLRAVDEAAAQVSLAGRRRRAAKPDRACGDLRARSPCWRSTRRCWTRACRLASTA